MQFVLFLISINKPDVIFLCETLVNTTKLNEIKIDIRVDCIDIHVDCCFVVDCIRHSGSIVVPWKDSSVVNIFAFSKNFIDIVIWSPNRESWRLRGFHGYLERGKRHDSWDLLKVLTGSSSLS